jgi:hypothetical protein
LGADRVQTKRVINFREGRLCIKHAAPSCDDKYLKISTFAKSQNEYA